MTSMNENQVKINVNSNYHGGGGSYLQKFRLYETRSNFYLIGRDKDRTCWKVLKIYRLEQSELSIIEDPTLYTQSECSDLLRRIHEGNKPSGGLKFVISCYGIVGFIKFLGPYYMLLITKRRKIGSICGHSVFSIAKSDMIPIPNSSVNSNMAFSKNENRYKKLLRAVDLTKDFFFSYSYHVMLSLQKNLSNHETGLKLYETMFVWNEFLTRGIRNQLNNSAWTVALVYGFFKQLRLSISGHEFSLILIARRSRHYAGTRYLKRGVNEKGRVANEVETEQIVLEDMKEGTPILISSVVQMRGSIPLFWSQETSRLNIKPDIVLSNKDDKYEATRLHFENLARRYGNPIIILNLIKTREKKPRESILRAGFANAIEVINKDRAHESRLKFLHWDLSKYSRNKAERVLAYLVKVAAYALDLTGFFCCQVRQSSSDVNGSRFIKIPLFQRGVLRTNCIDCLDRTNVAQYVYGLVALGCQLHALGYIDVPSINLDSHLADALMKIYESMGDTLALQYGGSAAHNKIFSERRGQWKAAMQSQEFLRTLQRYYSNAYMDAEKQDAINVFLGHFQPQQGKPALWELDSDQHYNIGRRGSEFSEECARSIIKRSLSDGNILCDSDSIHDMEVMQMDNYQRPLPVKVGYHVGLLESTPGISSRDNEISYSRYTPSMCRRHLFQDAQPEQYIENDIYFVERGDSFNCSNFLDVDWISSSGNSCEEETSERSMLIRSMTSDISSSDEIKVGRGSSYYSGLSSKGNEVGSSNGGGGSSTKSNDVPGFSERFILWVSGDVHFA